MTGTLAKRAPLVLSMAPRGSAAHGKIILYRRLAACLLATTLLAGCDLAPHYKRPAPAVPSAFPQGPAYAAASGLRRLLARSHLGNRRSDNLLATLGFQEEGLLRGHVLRDGERRDCRLFGLLL